MQHPFEKLLALFAILFFNNRDFSLAEQMGKDRLNSSKQSIARLLKQLPNSGIGSLHREIRNREAYSRLERPKTTHPVSLNA